MGEYWVQHVPRIITQSSYEILMGGICIPSRKEIPVGTQYELPLEKRSARPRFKTPTSYWYDEWAAD
jgi:hypothetical protein